MRLLICAGGTGGGVYPALAVHNALITKHPSVQTLWVGGVGGMEAALIQRAGIAFETIPAAGIHGIGLRQLPGNLWQLIQGFFASRRIIRRFKPDVLFFTGGYVSVPMALAGRRIPTVLLVPDIEPGLALKTLSGFADCITVTSTTSRRFYARRRVVVTGYPVRADLLKWKKSMARKKMELTSNLPVLLVFGGSKGARSINMALFANLADLLDLVEIIHISGELDWPTVEATKKELPRAKADRYHVFAYLHEEIGAAFAAAELTLSRAGASTLGELPAFGLPAILVPYPYAWRYQKVNAEYLSNQGAAVVLEDAELIEKLLPTLKNLLLNPAKLKSMRDAMQSLAQPQAAPEIASQLVDLAQERR